MTDYTLVTNSVQPQQVRETEDAYVIEDVPFVKPMDLAGGYVPEQSIEDTIDHWDGVPATLRHPRNARGEPVAANRQPDIHLGIGEAPYYDGDVARFGQLVINKDRLDTVDGADDVREALENEEPIDVSSQYAAEDLPPGEYDGAMRENVERITRPDSVAILPDQRGRCSIEDGCGIDPQLVANAEVAVPMQATDDPTGARSPDSDSRAGMQSNASVRGVEWSGLADGDLDKSEIPNDDYESHYVFDADTKSASGFPLVGADGDLRYQNVAAAFRFRSDAPDEDTLLAVLEEANQAFAESDEFDEPPIDPDSLEEALSANSVFQWGLDRVAEFVGVQADNEPAESGADAPSADGESIPRSVANSSDPGSDPGIDMERDTLIDEITSNSEIERESLEGMGDQCLKVTHENIVGNDDADDSDADDDTTTMDDDTDTDYVTHDDLDDLKESIVDDVADQVTANQENSQKDELAREIVANSADYDDPDAVRDDYPTEAALETKRDQVTGGAAMPGAGGGLDANLGEDDDYDVSPGVLGGDD